MTDQPSFIAPSDARPDCELCSAAGGLLVVDGGAWRVVRVVDADFPAFYRVIWQAHVGEWTDLDEPARHECLRIVALVERVLRNALAPTKINLASLGNVVPHLHWHVVARFDWDSHYPQPIWGQRQREVPGGAVARLARELQALDEAVRAALLPPQGGVGNVSGAKHP